MRSESGQGKLRRGEAGQGRRAVAGAGDQPVAPRPAAPPDDLIEEGPTPRGGLDPDRVIRWTLWVMAVSTVLLVAFVIYASVRWGLMCGRTVSSCRF